MYINNNKYSLVYIKSKYIKHPYKYFMLNINIPICVRKNKI